MQDDLVSQLFCRGLFPIVEDILIHTTARTVAACMRVCRFWNAQFTEGCVWRSLFVKMFRRRADFRLLCCHNGWADLLPRQARHVGEPATYRQILYKATCFREIWCQERMFSAKLYTGYLIACLKVARWPAQPAAATFICWNLFVPFYQTCPLLTS
jgi:hypothetical protein